MKSNIDTGYFPLIYIKHSDWYDCEGIGCQLQIKEKVINWKYQKKYTIER